MAYKRDASAPPFCDAGKTSGSERATAAHEAAQRSRLSGTGVYKAPADTGSSGKMPTGRATEALVLGRNGKR